MSVQKINRMNANSLSLHNEMSNVLAQRALKIALVFGLHVGIAALLMHASQVSATKHTLIRVESRPIEVSFVQAHQQAPAVPEQPKQVTQPRIAPVKPPQKTELHTKPRPAPTSVQPTLAATPHVEPAATAQPQAPIKQDTTPAQTASKPGASKPASTIAAHVDANYAQKTEPPYPAISRRLHEEGKVQLLVDVSPKGEVESILVKQSSGYPRLDDVALNTVRLWRFVPAHQGDVAVADSVVVPILFKLHE
jgi:protein TonB